MLKFKRSSVDAVSAGSNRARGLRHVAASLMLALPLALAAPLQASAQPMTPQQEGLVHRLPAHAPAQRDEAFLKGRYGSLIEGAALGQVTGLLVNGGLCATGSGRRAGAARW